MPTRKLKPYRLMYERVHSYENSNQATIRMKRLIGSCSIVLVSEVQKYSGNLGVIEIYPAIPKDLILKLEGPAAILEEIRFNLINGICDDDL